MVKKISLIASMIFFLFVSNVMAGPIQPYTSRANTPQLKLSHTLVIKASKAPAEKTTKESNRQSSEKKTTEPTIKEYAVPAAIALFIIIFTGSYWLFFRKKLISK